MIIRLAEKDDIEQIADIHQKEINKGFLSGLGSGFLEKVYLAIIKSKISFCVVDEENGKITGFIAGAVNLDKFFRYFLKNHFFTAFFSLSPQIFNLKKIKKIIEVLFYPKKGNSLPEAELLTIAVINEFQGQGIAVQMLARFIYEMKNRKIGSFKVIVGESLTPAIKFYEKSGFRFVKNINIHGNYISRVYAYYIK